MAKTKLGSASRFGSRYGSPLKKRIRDIEKVQKRAQECPQCGRRSLRRKGYARWECKKCGAVMAGGAYSPSTGIGTIAKRVVERGEKYEEAAKEVEAEAAAAERESAEREAAESKKKEKPEMPAGEAEKKKKKKEIKVNVG